MTLCVFFALHAQCIGAGFCRCASDSINLNCHFKRTSEIAAAAAAERPLIALIMRFMVGEYIIIETDGGTKNVDFVYSRCAFYALSHPPHGLKRQITSKLNSNKTKAALIR